MKKISSIFILLLISITLVLAQGQRVNRKFNSKRFQEQLEKHILLKVQLTQKEKDTFFPLYQEMRKKHEILFEKQRKLHLANTNDDKIASKVIKEQDKIDIEIKELQQSYHNKFLRILPANKLFKILRAEEEFHRKMFKQFNK